MSEPFEQEESLHDQIAVDGMYQQWFLEYASYVILERAVPAIEDGLKPVQRRILHALNELDDGRFNKVANVVGAAMQYHPHGDASIYDAIVNVGQKGLLFDCQGNWGDINTGDSAAAARYIEVRLSAFGREVVFNDDTTEWQLSYDGRKREPVTLPVKFPLLLAQGVEGIAVGLSTKILPHNFIELCEASIDILKGNPISLLPDFPTGGMVDTTNYNDGQRGGKVRVRAKIKELDKKTLVITEIPYGATTTSVKDSIIKANDEGKIKIRKVEDLTSKNVEIHVHLAPGVSPDITIDALYAFTECEVSISPNACVITADKPIFSNVSDILRINTEQTKELLRRELEIRRLELQEKILFSSLEKIFIENRIYRQIEECETFEAVVQTVDKGLDPYKKDFYREITEEDILRLLEIRIKRISKYDAFKADEAMKRLEKELAEVMEHLAHMTRFAIDYFKNLLKKFGKGRERKTEIKSFNTVSVAVVAATNAKLYVNREDGFIGFGLKKDEYVCDCSDIDDIIVFRRDGKCLVTKIQDKVFVGKDIMYCGVFRKGDDRRVYNLMYSDSKSGVSYAKRFCVTAVTRDREYDLTAGNPKSKVLWFTVNDNGEAETVEVKLTASSTAKVKQFEWDFAKLSIKNREALGNQVTKYPIRKVELKRTGVSTLGGVDIWYDPTISRLNRDNRGQYLGNFEAKDSILVIYKDGNYELTSFELTNRYEQDQILSISKFTPETVISAIHFDGGQKNYFVKRFHIETTTVDKKFYFIGEAKGSKLLVASVADFPRIELSTKETDKGPITKEELAVDELVEVRGWKALGNKLTSNKVVEVKALAPKIVEKPVEQETKPVKSVAENLEEKEIENQEDPASLNQLDLFG
ncbi:MULTISPECIES: DNA gyrase/topoisomerase IV subunit A [unclassified Siphonobacter]|uniref:DNA gyrase/topoisomerase IV subunit A n=1 Tax=unclassified Siphonobacter TaxID=2635712 RepID=UPI000CC8D83D|nr:MULTISPECIES: DNA gyrase/topoisomerase IV subunit A [unclassified Siphonobacter]MDQ1088813.1 topoisomerase-4 subunit A [Siphonobacter sp. SORGH_AS_1065]MDR6194998.1 topoisomerase-4 subunit A [Siphonobacter sp. SORGH_AS_0500]PKK38458.1 DNA topoisomerase IV [Siphonobacter sp. SORGH_AS_0500]